MIVILFIISVFMSQDIYIQVTHIALLHITHSSCEESVTILSKHCAI